MTEGGWTNRRAYPLLISSETEMALTRYRSDKNVTIGRALNDLVKMGLQAAGYMIDPAKCEHQWQPKTIWNGDRSFKIVVCSRCGSRADPETQTKLLRVLL